MDLALREGLSEEILSKTPPEGEEIPVRPSVFPPKGGRNRWLTNFHLPRSCFFEQGGLA